MVRNIAKIVSAAVLYGLVLGTPAESADRLTVVELFTSQGCSSCPPADKFLGELADRDDILALSWNIDYWDYLGWRDTLARPENTERQRAYNRALGKSGVYTPQMIINGRYDVVGSRHDEAMALIEAEQSKAPPLALAVTGSGPVRRVEIGAGTPGKPASVWVVEFDRSVRVSIKRGELSGRTMTYHNVVRASKKLGVWEGAPITFELDLGALAARGRDACAVIVQEGNAGPVLAARRFIITRPE